MSDKTRATHEFIRGEYWVRSPDYLRDVRRAYESHRAIVHQLLEWLNSGNSITATEPGSAKLIDETSSTGPTITGLTITGPMRDAPLCDQPCSRCGSTDIYRRWYRAGEVIIDDHRMRFDSTEWVDRSRQWEHRVLKECVISKCRVCGYQWDSDPQSV